MSPTALTTHARLPAILLRSRSSPRSGRYRGPWCPRSCLGLAGEFNRRSYPLQAAIVALPIVQLQQADYFISHTLRISAPHVILRGVSRRFGGAANPATRVVVRSSTEDTIFIGTVANPGSINGFLTQVEVHDLDVTRDRVVTPPGVGSEISGAAGIRLQFTLLTRLEHVHSSEHTIGFLLNGTVRTTLTDCFAARSTGGTSTTNDIFFGFWLNGNVEIGAAGGNASTYLTDCNASIGGVPPVSDSYGFAVTGKPVDTFFFRPEASALKTGILITGDQSAAGNADVHVINPIIDQFGVHGLYLDKIGNYGAIDVIGGYFAPVGGSVTTYCMRIANSTGMVALTNNRCIAWHNSLTLGTVIENSTGVVAKSNMHLGVRRPVSLVNASGCNVQDIMNNPQEVAVQGAIWATGSSRNYLAPVVRGGAGVFPQGVNLIGAGNANNEVNCTGIDPAAIIGGAANKLQIGGVSVTTVGLSGTNLASGVMQ